MDEIEQKRISLYKQSSEKTQNLYADGALGGMLGDLIREFTIPLEKQKAFIHVYGDAILGLHTVNDIPAKLTSLVGLTPEQAGIAREKTKSFLSKIDGSVAVPDANIESKERLELRPQGQAGTGGAQPLTRDALMNAVSGKRTMAQDIEALRMKREADKGSAPPVPPRPPAP